MNLNERLGPLPVWGWGLIGVVAGGVMFLALRRREGAAPVPSAGSSAPAGGAQVTQIQPVILVPRQAKSQPVAGQQGSSEPSTFGGV